MIAGETGTSERKLQTQATTNGHASTNGHTARQEFGASSGMAGGNFEARSESRPSFDRSERPKVGAMEVAVDHNIEKAMKILKRKLIKEGLFKELKARRYFEKPSERRKRKQKESIKKMRKEESRNKKNSLLA